MQRKFPDHWVLLVPCVPRWKIRLLLNFSENSYLISWATHNLEGLMSKVVRAVAEGILAVFT